jgi:hypothetical protein
MTYPGGAPGGYPGQGPQQPHQAPGYGRPPASGTKLGLPQIMYLVVGGLGLINFFCGFADIYDGADGSFFGAPTPVPALFLLGGLFVLPAVLPGGSGKAGISPAAFSVTGMLTVLFFTFSTDPDLGVGSILLLIFGILQGIAGVGAYLFEAGIIKPPVPGGGQPPQQFGHQQPGMYPPSSPFPAQQPPPGQYPQPGQATTFAPQQGQFGQPGQQQHPGTPPGGYPQG